MRQNNINHPTLAYTFELNVFPPIYFTRKPEKVEVGAILFLITDDPETCETVPLKSLFCRSAIRTKTLFLFTVLSSSDDFKGYVCHIFAYSPGKECPPPPRRIAHCGVSGQRQAAAG